jgi:hypothetical protein
MRIPMLALALALTGCVPSLQPLYTEKDTVFDPALVGVWEKDKEVWTLRAGEGKAYEVTMQSEKWPKAGFEAHLVELGKARFLDLYPQEQEEGNAFYEFHRVPAHSISRIWLEGDTLRAAMLQDGWLEARIRDGQVQIGHQFGGPKGDGLVLTAPTGQLQALVMRYADDTKAFADPQRYRRVK